MYKTQFAVTHTIGNDEVVIQTFTDKESMLSFGKSIIGTYHDGVIVCLQADFDENLKMKNNACRIYEVWQAGKSYDF